MTRRDEDYRWVIVATLSVTETVSWGIVYYAFGVLLAPMETELGWSRAQSTGAFSLALLFAAAGAVPAGRWVDRGGARVMMTLGSCAASALLVAWAQVETLGGLYLVWVVMGITMAAILYEPAFAVIAKWFTHDRDRAFTILTLAAGFASTIFNPLTSWLVDAVGWRSAILVLAAILAVTTIPLHALLLRGQPGHSAPAIGAVRVSSVPATDPPDLDTRAALRSATFWLLAVGFVIQSFVHAGVSLHAVALLVEWGHPRTFAATVVGLVGAMQVGGRLVFGPLRTRLSRRAVAMLVFALQGVALLVLRIVPGLAGVFGYVVCFGIGNGMTTLMRASIVADLYGRAHYGSIGGVLALCTTGARAVAPVTLGLLYELRGEYASILVLLALLSGVAVVSSALALGRAAPRAPRASA